MKKVFRYTCLFLAVIFISGLLSACYDKREIDDLAYVIAIGIDEGKANNLLVTLQIAIPGSIAGGSGGGASSGGGGGGGGGQKPFLVTSVEAPTIYSALNMANTYVNRQINLSNAIALVFSKALAEKGVEYLINAVARGREFRPSMYVVVSRTTAEDYIKNVIPVLENNPSKYYQLNFTSYEYTALSANSQFHNFSTYMGSLDRQAIAILGGVNEHEKDEDIDIRDSTYLEKGRSSPLEGDYKAGHIPRFSGTKSEVMGLAVFDGDKMVGELDGEETAYYLLVTGEYRNAFWTMPDPQAKNRYVILNIRQNRKPQQEVNFIDGKPQISVKVLLEADITSIQSGINYEIGEETKKLERSAMDFLDNGITRLLNKTAKEFHSDIFGLGAVTKSRFLTFQQFEQFKWKSRYKDSSFTVDVSLKIRRPGILIRSPSAVNSGGEGGMQF